MSSIFIDIKLSDEVKGNAEAAAKLEEVCPVDIYRNADGRTEIVEENLDECVLCNLCVEATPPGSVEIIKLYES
jgi:NAD-dependent dihydropyrimidine dehydrogenase PreA subunit